MTTPATPATLRLLSAFHYESARANLGSARVLRRFGAEAAAASAILRARESRRLARAARSHPDTESYRYAVVARVCVCQVMVFYVGHAFDAATPAPSAGTPADAVPTPGALTLCFGCGRPYQVGEGLTMLPVDLDAMPIDPEHRREIRRLQRAIVTMRGRQS